MRTAFTLIVPPRGEAAARGSTEKLVIERKVTTETVTQIDSPRFRGEPAPIDRDRRSPEDKDRVPFSRLDEIDICRRRRWERAAVCRGLDATL